MCEKGCPCVYFSSSVAIYTLHCEPFVPLLWKRDKILCIHLHTLQHFTNHLEESSCADNMPGLAFLTGSR